MQNKAVDYTASCLIAAVAVIVLLGNFGMLLMDTDSAWHLMAGDLIRSGGAIPRLRTH